MGLKPPGAECWQWTSVGGARQLHCRHPRPVRSVIARITLIGPGGEEDVVERPPQQRGRAVMARLEPGRPAAVRVRAELDLQEECASLQALLPRAPDFAGWLSGLRHSPRRWRGLVLAAASGDPWLVPPDSYERRFVPLLLRHALLNPVEDPALGVLLGFSARARRLHAWLLRLQGAGCADLPLLKLGQMEGLGEQERLLGLEQLAQTGAGERFQPPATVQRIPLLQYWEGDPTPTDVETLLKAWPAAYPELQPHRFDAARALAWIRDHCAPEDQERFRRCWHPAMQSDFLRVLHVAHQGGVYLDCDTPVPASAEARRLWMAMAQHCWGSRTLALCANAVRQPNDLRHYVVNCCLWAPPGHALMQRWLVAFRERFDGLPAELVGTPRGIHALGPELAGELVDGLLGDRETQLKPLLVEGVRVPRLCGSSWSLLLFSTRVYRKLFDVPFSCHASYQSCNDPRDWKVGVAL